MTGKKGRSGGARPGPHPGRPRTIVGLRMPPDIVKQLDEIAAHHGVAVEQIVKEAILSFISDWQAEHDVSSAR